MPLSLGIVPDHLEVTLTYDADFIDSCDTLTADQTTAVVWPTGTTIYLILGDPQGDHVTWNAVVASSVVSWNVDAANVNAVINAGYKAAYLWYENGTVKTPLAVGDILIYG